MLGGHAGGILPIEVWAIILQQHVAPTQHATLSMVCRTFRTLLRARACWTGVSLAYLHQILDDAMVEVLCRNHFLPIDPDVQEKRLLRVDLSQCERITDRSLEVLGTRCPGLAQVVLAGCSRVTDRGLVALGLRCRLLHACDLRGLPEITDEGLAQNCRELQELDISSCPGLTDVGILGAVRTLTPSLRVLGVEGNPKVNAPLVMAMLQAAPGLQALRLRGCALDGPGAFGTVAQGPAGPTLHVPSPLGHLVGLQLA